MWTLSFEILTLEGRFLVADHPSQWGRQVIMQHQCPRVLIPPSREQHVLAKWDCVSAGAEVVIAPSGVPQPSTTVDRGPFETQVDLIPIGSCHPPMLKKKGTAAPSAAILIGEVCLIGSNPHVDR